MATSAALPGSGRQRVGLPFAVIGTACVVAGGLVAAADAHAPSEHAVWAAAYLVLVAGVAQVAVGAAQAYLNARRPSRPVVVAELLGWNLGNAAVIAGTIAGFSAVTDVGGVLLIGALVLLLTGTRGGRAGSWLRCYRILLTLVLVSIPIGLVIGQVSAR